MAQWIRLCISEKENEKESGNELITKCRIIIRQFVDDISEIINQSDADTLAADDIKLLELITACRNKLADVHNKIGDPEWTMLMMLTTLHIIRLHNNYVKTLYKNTKMSTKVDSKEEAEIKLEEMRR